ncbi:MAG: hypothetical protein FJW77_01180 [Actinobacteria bacterium]|nr:hypothetical protein [Actinomycetota bacterium]
MPSLTPLILASGGLTERSLWYPTILGVLVVVAGVILFVGSIYLLLGTNMGARLAFLATFSGLMGLMLVLTSLWITTASPLNTLRGSVPAWKIQEVVPSLEESKIVAVRNIEADGVEVDAVEAANVKAAVDEGLVTKEDTATKTYTEEENKFAIYSDVTKYLTPKTWEIGGSNPSWLDGEFTHAPKYAVVEFCGVAPNRQPFGVAPDKPTCAAAGTPEAKDNGYVVLEYNLGDVRLPPIIAFVSSLILFVLSLALFGWYERDRRAVQAAEAASAQTPARSRELVNA